MLEQIPSVLELYSDDATPDKNLITTSTRKTLAILATVGIVALSTMTACTPNKTSVTYNPPAQTQPIDANALYRSNTQAAILQTIPELANYRSALDYTTQRLTDMKNVYNIQLDQAIVPVSKWIKANIDWDKKSERLVPFSEEIDFMPDAMFLQNFTANKTVNDRANATGVQFSMDKFAIYEEELVNEHDSVWADLHNPTKMQKYLDTADIGAPLWWTEQEATKYKSAIRKYGTFEDKAHWALVGRAWAYGIGNEELARNEQPLAYILAVGGKAQIAHNIAIKELPAPSGTDPRSKYVARGDRQLAIKISQQLENAIRNDPGLYGHPIDSGYLQPQMPNMEAIDALAEASKRDPKSNGDTRTMFVYRTGNYNGKSGSEKIWLVGNAKLAYQYNAD